MKSNWDDALALWVYRTPAAEVLPRLPRPIVKFVLIPMSAFLSIVLMIALSCGGFFVLIGLPLWKTIPAIREARRLSKSEACPPFEGNSDMYGLGIRIATYLQVGFPSFLNLNRHQKYAAAFTSVNIWFLFALFIALCTMLRNRETPPLDMYIITAMGNGIMGNLLAGVAFAPVAYLHETTSLQIGKAVTGFLWHLCTTIYWWKVMPTSVPQSTESSTCPLNAWMFVRVSLEAESPLQKVHKAVNIWAWLSLTVIWIYVLHLTCTTVRYILVTRDSDLLRISPSFAVDQAAIHPLRNTTPGELEDLVLFPPAGAALHVPASRPSTGLGAGATSTAPIPRNPMETVASTSAGGSSPGLSPLNDDISDSASCVGGNSQQVTSGPSQHSQHRYRPPSKYARLYDLLCNCPNGDLQPLFGWFKAKSELRVLRNMYLSQRHSVAEQQHTLNASNQSILKSSNSVLSSLSQEPLVHPLTAGGFASQFLPRTASFIWLTWTILSIEFTLALNNVFSVNSLAPVGQVVPLVVSVGACLNIVLGIIGDSAVTPDELDGSDSQLDDSKSQLDSSASQIDIPGSPICALGRRVDSLGSEVDPSGSRV